MILSRINLRKRLKATAVHLLFSIIIFIVFIVFMLKYWYPMPHFLVNGGWQGTQIMVIVDLVIGPLLTFILFNPNKSLKEIYFDLGIIILLQLGLLIFGLQKVYSQRPVVQVLTYRGFIASPREEDLLVQNNITNPITYINDLNVYNYKPAMVYSVYENYYASGAISFENLYEFRKDESQKSLSPEDIVSRYRPLNSPDAQADILSASEKALNRFRAEPKNLSAIEAYQQSHGNNFYFFPLRGQYGDAIMVLDKLTQKPVDYFNVELFVE